MVAPHYKTLLKNGKHAQKNQHINKIVNMDNQMHKHGLMDLGHVAMCDEL